MNISQPYETLRRYARIVGIRGLTFAILGKVLKRRFLLTMRSPLMRFPCSLRCPSSDVPTYEQVFLKHEYDFEVSRPPRFIVDAGANIGLASIYFASRFPEARIIAIEPENSNVAVLRLNTRDYPNITVFAGALWGRDETLHVIDNDYGKWGFMTAPVGDAQAPPGVVTQDTHGISVPSLMERYGIDRIDIFKIDIEGAEKELFADCGAWIDRVDALIVELHDRMKPGCSDSFRSGVVGFDAQWRLGENEYLSRRRGCMMKPAGGRVGSEQ